MLGRAQGIVCRKRRGKRKLEVRNRNKRSKVSITLIVNKNCRFSVYNFGQVRRSLMGHRSATSRREFVRRTAALGLGLAIPCAYLRAAQRDTVKTGPVLSPDEAFKELMAGNERFVKGLPESPRRSPQEFTALAAGQYPEAVIVSCADSRVAPELLFDVGVGDIFVVRVAGNVIGGTGVTVKGSIEYAVAELNVPLIFVLGHSGCGAVKSAMKHIDSKDSLPGAINGLVELVKPAVHKSKGMPGDALENAIAMNVQLGVDKLNRLDPIVAPRVKEGKLKVVGGVYDLKSGAVKML
jgi:carbonic anhydrase